MNRHRAAWVVLLSVMVVVILLMWTAVVSPRIQEIDAANEQTEQLEQQNFVMQKEIEKLNIASGTITLETVRLKQLRREISNSYDQQALINSLNLAAITSGITLTSVSFGTAVDATLPSAVSSAISNRLIQIPLTINAEGTYDKLRTFVAPVQTIERVTVPTALSYTLGSGTASDTSTSTDSLSMTCSTYSLVDSTSIAGLIGSGSTTTGSTGTSD